MTIIAAIAAAGVGMAALVLFMGLGRIIQARASLMERLDILAPVPAIEDVAAGESQQIRQPRLVARIINRFVPTERFSSSTAAELARANLALTVPEYVLLRLASVLGAFLLTMAFSGQLMLGLTGAVVGFFLPRLYIQRRQEQRQKAFQGQLVDVLALLVGALRSGYGMTIAMDSVAQQMPSPSSEEFGRVVREIGLGVPGTQALQNLVRRIRSDDLDLVVTAIIIQYEVGGNLAEILDTISDTIRERIRLQQQLHVLTTQPRVQRAVLTGLPVVLAVIMYLLNPEYMRLAFQPGAGMIIFLAAGVLMAMGYVVMGKLSKIDV
jgi:tight adherence protein B